MLTEEEVAEKFYTQPCIDENSDNYGSQAYYEEIS